MRRMDFLWSMTAGALAVGLAACKKEKDAGDHLEDAGESVKDAAKSVGKAAEKAAEEVKETVDKD